MVNRKNNNNGYLDASGLPTAMATAYGSRAASSDTMASACLTPTESAQAILKTKKHESTHTPVIFLNFMHRYQ